MHQHRHRAQEYLSSWRWVVRVLGELGFPQAIAVKIGGVRLFASPAQQAHHGHFAFFEV
jgi:hypothetical protein